MKPTTGGERITFKYVTPGIACLHRIDRTKFLLCGHCIGTVMLLYYHCNYSAKLRRGRAGQSWRPGGARRARLNAPNAANHWRGTDP